MSGPVREPTARQLEVLRLTAAGLSLREIGARLYMTVDTVKKHRVALLRNLGARNAPHAVHRGWQYGYLGGAR